LQKRISAALSICLSVRRDEKCIHIFRRKKKPTIKRLLKRVGLIILKYILEILYGSVCVKWIQTLQASSQTMDYCEHGNKTLGSAAGRQFGPAQWRTVWYSAMTPLNRLEITHRETGLFGKLSNSDLRSALFCFVTDVSGQPIGHITTSQEFLEEA